MANNIISIILKNSGFYSALFGALVGGLLSLLGTFLSNWLNDKSRVRKDRENVRATLLAIKTEITSIHKIYKETAGDELTKTPGDSAFPFYYPASQDYFTVFTNNTALIGQITDSELRELIINAYTEVKGLLDSFRMNNYMLEKWEYFNALFEETSIAHHKKQADSWLAGMIKYCNSLKTMGRRAVETKNQLVKKIDSYLSI
jgi:hypothetical protein